jgi:hypothetical protein
LLEKEVFQVFTGIQTSSLKERDRMDAKPTSLEFLQAVYLNEQLPLSVRMRAAIEAAPYEHAKITAVAIGHLTGQDFYNRLEHAINRSECAKLIEGRAIRDENCG